MYIAIDLILVIIMGAVIFSAARKGFIRSVFELLSTIASIVVAAIFHKQLGAYFYDKFVFGHVNEYIRGLIEKAVQGAGESINPANFFSNLPPQIQSIADAAGLNMDTLADKYSGVTEVTDEYVQSISESISGSLATMIANMLAFAAIFFGMMIILGLVCLILNSLASLPLLKGTNRFLGFVLGVAEALIIGVIISYVVSSLCNTYGLLNQEFAYSEVIEHTYVAKFLVGLCPK